MEIAVADMADDRRDEAALLDVLERLLDAIGEPRDRHAGVGGERPRAGPQRQLRPIGVVTRLPELGALLGLGRGGQRPAAMAGGDLAEAARLFGDALLGAVELDQEQRLLGQGGMRIIVEGAHRQRVDELDAGDRQARLDGLDRRLASRADAGKRAMPGGDRLGNAGELERRPRR